jgi:site-specific recombinase XerD
VQYLSTLTAAGYVENTQQQKRRLLVAFIRWARRKQLGTDDLTEESVGVFLARPARRRWHRGNPERVALQQFLEHLRRTGVVPPRHASVPSPAEVLVRRYGDHLRVACGLCPRSIEICRQFVRAFVSSERLPDHLADLDAAAVRRHLLDESAGRSGSFVKLLTAALRSFLRFLFTDGATATDLATAVPPVRRWRLATLPPSLKPDEVERVIAACDCSSARGRRDAAILLLLARLGLRAGEVVALELDDIHWDLGEIVIHGKGRRQDCLPLVEDVGEALAVYIHEARGPSSSRRVFLRRCAPHVGFSDPTAVCQVARQALRRAGLRLKGRVGAHIFRHSLATRMIRHGASLGEISQVLRHRSVETTQLYAKVELDALRGVALPWPVTEVRA